MINLLLFLKLPSFAEAAPARGRALFGLGGNLHITRANSRRSVQACSNAGMERCPVCHSSSRQRCLFLMKLVPHFWLTAAAADGATHSGGKTITEPPPPEKKASGQTDTLLIETVFCQLQKIYLGKRWRFHHRDPNRCLGFIWTHCQAKKNVWPWAWETHSQGEVGFHGAIRTTNKYSFWHFINLRQDKLKQR